MCDFFIHRWFWFNGLCFWLLHHSLRGYQPCHFVLHNPPQTGERKCVSCHRDNLMTYRSGEKKKKFKNHVTHLPPSYRHFTDSTRRKNRKIQHYERRKNSNFWKTVGIFLHLSQFGSFGNVGFMDSNRIRNVLNLLLGDNSGRMSTSEEVRQNPSLWSIFKKVKHSELKR